MCLHSPVHATLQEAKQQQRTGQCRVQKDRYLGNNCYVTELEEKMGRSDEGNQLGLEASEIRCIRGRKCSKMWNYSFRLGLFCDKLGAACEHSRGTRVVSANQFFLSAHLLTHVQIEYGGVGSSVCQHHRNVFADEEAPALSSLSISMSSHWVVRHQNRSQCLQSTSLSVGERSCETCIRRDRETEGEAAVTKAEEAVCHKSTVTAVNSNDCGPADDLEPKCIHILPYMFNVLYVASKFLPNLISSS